nr:flagellar assembly protein FliH [Proteus mirabilis]
MSDRINTLPWQPWSLSDLGEQKPAIELPQLPDLELDDPSPDAQAELQQQLATLRLQAEQQGQQVG